MNVQVAIQCSFAAGIYHLCEVLSLRLISLIRRRSPFCRTFETLEFETSKIRNSSLSLYVADCCMSVVGLIRTEAVLDCSVLCFFFFFVVLLLLFLVEFYG